MSIPKEPRQLMINLMYLVLTALLALNVSAEILNAFNTVNKGIGDSNELLNSKNELMMKMITSAAGKDGRAETQTILKQATEAQKLSAEFVAYVEELKTLVKEAAGGPSEENPEKLKTEGEMEKTSNLFFNRFFSHFLLLSLKRAILPSKQNRGTPRSVEKNRRSSKLHCFPASSRSLGMRRL